MKKTFAFKCCKRTLSLQLANFQVKSSRNKIITLGRNSTALLKSQQTFQQTFLQSFQYYTTIKTLLKSLLRFQQSYRIDLLFLQFYRKGSTGETSSLPFVAGALNCAVWTKYGAAIAQPGMNDGFSSFVSRVCRIRKLSVLKIWRGFSPNSAKSE